MTPGHYCVHAINDLERLIRQFRALGEVRDEKHCHTIYSALYRGEKFLLPNRGRLLDDTQPPEEIIKNLRLPFPITVLEFPYLPEPNGPDPVAIGQARCSRRIVVCIEPLVSHPTGYHVTTVDYLDSEREWQICPMMQWIPYNIKLVKRPLSEVNQLAMHYNPHNRTGLVNSFDTQTYVTAPWTLMRIANHMGIEPKELQQRIIIEMCSDWQAAVDLTNVLACSNTVTEKVDPPAALLKKRAKSGKPPLFSYHVLKVKPHSAGSGKPGVSYEDRRSPRQHVRRGHIRRYHKGEPNERSVFIQQMMVGNPALGKVEKDYDLYHS